MSAPVTPDAGPLLVELRGAGPRKVAFVTLNSEATLNSLTMEMIVELQPKLDAWRKDASVAAVVLQGAGDKAFCAGGDIRRLHQSITGKRHADAEAFFEKEYTLDHTIHTYPKPVLVWGHGIVMGGGLGLMAGASHRVVTEATKLAMPEITIGLYPDVGASYFLNRMPDGTGLFLGLTGARLNAADCLFTGLGNAFVARAHKEVLFQALESVAWSEKAVENRRLLNETLQRFEAQSVGARPQGEIERRMDTVRFCSSATSASEFLARLKERAGDDAWLGFALKSLASGSPTSARVIFEQLRRSRGYSLEEVFAQDMTLSTQCAWHSDLVEGIRALLIDKDNKPRWSPSRLEEVSDALVQEHFVWPHRDRPNPLEKWT